MKKNKKILLSLIVFFGLVSFIVLASNLSSLGVTDEEIRTGLDDTFNDRVQQGNGGSWKPNNSVPISTDIFGGVSAGSSGGGSSGGGSGGDGSGGGGSSGGGSGGDGSGDDGSGDDGSGDDGSGDDGSGDDGSGGDALPETQIPEFPAIALPVASILGLIFFFNYQKHKTIVINNREKK